MYKKLQDTAQRFFGTDISYLADSGKWLVMSQIINAALSIALAAAFANLLTQDAYGTYKYFVSLISLFAIFSLQGMSTALARTVSRGTETNIYEALKIKLRWSILGSVSAMIVSIYYFIQGDEYFGWTLAAISITIPLFGSLGVFQPYLSGKKNFKEVAKNSALIKTVSTILLTATVFFIQEIWVLVLAYVLLTILLNGVSLYYTLKKFPPHDTVVDRDLSDGKHLSIMGGVGVAMGTLQSIALWHFIGPAGLAVYALATAPIEQIRPFIKLTENIFLPKFAQDSWQTGNLRWFAKKLMPFASMITVTVIVYILLIPFAYQILFPLYTESIIYSQILAVGLLFTAMNVVVNAILKAKRKIHEMYIINSCKSAVDMFAIIVLVYYFGILGLVISVIIRKITLFCLGSYFILKTGK